VDRRPPVCFRGGILPSQEEPLSWSVSFLTPILLLPLLNCGGSQHDVKEKDFLVSANIKVPYWQAAAAGLNHAAAEMHVKAPISMLTRRSDHDAQKLASQSYGASTSIHLGGVTGGRSRIPTDYGNRMAITSSTAVSSS
jgi:hypothetical protein